MMVIDTLYDLMDKEIESGECRLILSNGEEIDAEIYVHDDDVIYSNTPILGDAVADSKMLILKYNKSLIIGSGVIMTPQVRKKGMLILCKGMLLNEGQISMSRRGAIATGQDVLLYRNTDGSCEYVPKDGGNGGAGGEGREGGDTAGESGQNRQSGGGGGGSRNYFSCDGGSTVRVRGGEGADGTSYSGGSGGGNAYSNTCTGNAVGGNADPNGGAGGSGDGSTGGAGNPGGANGGASGTGGLLIIFVHNKFINQGIVSADGANGGGGSGGGSVNIFAVGLNMGTFSAEGGSGGGHGGNGCISFDVLQGDFEKFEELQSKILQNLEQFKRQQSKSKIYIHECGCIKSIRPVNKNIRRASILRGDLFLGQRKDLKTPAIVYTLLALGTKRDTRGVGKAKYISSFITGKRIRIHKCNINAYKGKDRNINRKIIVRQPRLKILEHSWARVNNFENPYGGRVLKGVIICDTTNIPNDDGIPRVSPLEHSWTKID